VGWKVALLFVAIDDGANLKAVDLATWQLSQLAPAWRDCNFETEIIS
jgi:hypothetical protein